jgi:hypothetical protein
MPARKNRPDKHGARGAPPKADFLLEAVIGVGQIVTKLIEYEREHPGYDHDLSWCSPVAVEHLVKCGCLRVGKCALGCFAITDKFRYLFSCAPL